MIHGFYSGVQIHFHFILNVHECRIRAQVYFSVPLAVQQDIPAVSWSKESTPKKGILSFQH